MQNFQLRNLIEKKKEKTATMFNLEFRMDNRKRRDSKLILQCKLRRVKIYSKMCDQKIKRHFFGVNTGLGGRNRKKFARTSTKIY